ncbi:MAG: methyltransferase domain-containing protein [Methanomicrobiales archaeon]|nr:methyltransferase domain-containing protein [Methanomicrobiales archaeon]
MKRELSSTRYEPVFIDLTNKNDSRTLTIDLVGENKKVLEIGTSTGYVSKILKEHNNTIIGIEIDEGAGIVAEQYCDQVIIGDVETIDYNRYFQPESFDVILCADVIEHLRNPKDFLKNIKQYLKDDGYLVVSIPNFCHGDVIIRVLLGDFHYTPVGLLDETHLRFFGLNNIYSLFSDCGYTINNLQKTIVDIGTSELKIEGDRVHHDILSLLRSLPNSNVYQFIFTAYPAHEHTNYLKEEPDLVAIMERVNEESRLELRYAISELLEINAQQKNLISELENQIKESVLSVRIFHKFMNFFEYYSPEGTRRRSFLSVIAFWSNVYYSEGLKTCIERVKPLIIPFLMRK